MLHEASFAAALRMFHRIHANTVESLRAAIETFRREEIHRVNSENPDLSLFTVDTELGPDTALMVTGFKNAAQIECFVAERLHAPGK